MTEEVKSRQLVDRRLRARQVWRYTENLRSRDEKHPSLAILRNECDPRYVLLEHLGWQDGIPEGEGEGEEKWMSAWSSNKGSFTTWIKTNLRKWRLEHDRGLVENEDGSAAAREPSIWSTAANTSHDEQDVLASSPFSHSQVDDGHRADQDDSFQLNEARLESSNVREVPATSSSSQHQQSFRNGPPIPSVLPEVVDRLSLDDRHTGATSTSDTGLRERIRQSSVSLHGRTNGNGYGSGLDDGTAPTQARHREEYPAMSANERQQFLDWYREVHRRELGYSPGGR